MEKNIPCELCIVGTIFALTEVFLVIGENLGWIGYNMDFDSYLFFIFLIFIASYQKKNQNKKVEVEKFE